MSNLYCEGGVAIITDFGLVENHVDVGLY